MADTVEVLRVEYEKAAAQAAAEEYRAQLQRVEQEILDLKSAMAQGTIGADAFDAGIKKSELEQKKLQYELARSEAGLKGASSGLAGAGQSFLQTGRIVQDFAQGGIGGVLNNIEGLVQALGGTAGLAGILTVVGVSFALLKPQIVAFLDSLKSDNVERFKSSVERLKDRVKELTDNPAKLAVDVLELDIAQSKLDALIKSQQAFQALTGQRSRLERESGQEVEALIGEEAGGVAKLTAEVKRLLLQDLTASNGFLKSSEQRLAELEAEIPKRAAAAARGGDPATQRALDQALTEARAEQAAIQEQRRKMRDLLEKESQTRTADVFTGAFAGDVGQQRRLAELARRTGRGQLAGNIPGASPAAIAAAEDEDRAELEFQQQNERAKQARLKREAARKKATQTAEQEAKDEEAFTDVDQRESDRRLAARRAAEKAAAKANETKVNRQLEEDKKALEEATKPFEAQAEFAILQGARGTFPSERARKAFQQRSDEAIRQQARVNLIAQGVDPDEARSLALRAPQEVSKNLQQKNLALQAQGLTEVQRTQALVSVLIADIGRVEGQVNAVRGRNDGLIRERQQIGRTAQNRARN